MANSLSYRTGQRQLVRPAVDSATVIEIGDLCWFDTDDVKPANAYTWSSDGPTTKAGFANKFMGIADQSSAAGQTDPVDIDIATDAIYEFTIISATVELFAEFQPDDSASLLVNQVLEKSSNSEIVSIARAVERYTSATTKCHVQFASAYQVGANTAQEVLG